MFPLSNEATRSSGSAAMAGFYTTSDIGSVGGVNNDGSSMTIPDGWEVALFDGDNFSVSSWVLTSANPA